MDTHVELSMRRVVNATRLVRKSELARRAGVPESTVRELGTLDWKPNAETLLKLEVAAAEVEREHGLAAVAAHRESEVPNPRAGKARR